jgi:amidase
VSELWRKGAVELAKLISDREVSSREVVQAHLDRVEEVNPHLNAIVRLLPDQALAAADAADRAVADRSALGPLHGVPCTVKENIDLAGTPTTQAVPALAEAIAPVDAPQVERLRAAGMIPIGRTNLPDFGLRVHTDSALHGLTRNPWNPQRTAGGSSGGEAAALATGMSPLGQRPGRVAAQPGALLRHRVDQTVHRRGARRDRHPAGGLQHLLPDHGRRGRDGPARG